MTSYHRFVDKGGSGCHMKTLHRDFAKVSCFQRSDHFELKFKEKGKNVKNTDKCEKLGIYKTTFYLSE